MRVSPPVHHQFLVYFRSHGRAHEFLQFPPCLVVLQCNVIICSFLPQFDFYLICVLYVWLYFYSGPIYNGCYTVTHTHAIFGGDFPCWLVCLCEQVVNTLDWHSWTHRMMHVWWARHMWCQHWDDSFAAMAPLKSFRTEHSMLWAALVHSDAGRLSRSARLSERHRVTGSVQETRLSHSSSPRTVGLHSCAWSQHWEHSYMPDA